MGGRKGGRKFKPRPSAGLRPLGDAPRWLDSRGRAEWRRIAPELRKTAAALDESTLAAYCQSFSRWRQAEDALADAGLTDETKNGNLIQHPLVGTANRAMELMAKLAAEFGMTPCSRARLKPPEEKPADAGEYLLDDHWQPDPPRGP